MKWEIPHKVVENIKLVNSYKVLGDLAHDKYSANYTVTIMIKLIC